MDTGTETTIAREDAADVEDTKAKGATCVASRLPGERFVLSVMHKAAAKGRLSSAQREDVLASIQAFRDAEAGDAAIYILFEPSVPTADYGFTCSAGGLPMEKPEGFDHAVAHGLLDLAANTAFPKGKSFEAALKAAETTDEVAIEGEIEGEEHLAALFSSGVDNKTWATWNASLRTPADI